MKYVRLYATEYRVIDVADVRVVNYSTLRKNLKDYLDAVCRDRQALVVARRNDEHVVMISMDEYRSLAETEYLLAEEANARHLRDSLRAARAGEAEPRALIED